MKVGRLVAVLGTVLAVAAAGAVPVRATGPDVAQGATTAVPCYNGSQYGPLATDGSDVTFWRSCQEGAARIEAAYVQIDLGVARSIESWRVKQSDQNLGAGVTGYSLRTASAEAGPWTAVGGYASGAPLDGGGTFGAPVAARFWRVVATAGTVGYRWNVYAVQLFEAVAPTPTPTAAPTPTPTAAPTPTPGVGAFDEDIRDRVGLGVFVDLLVGGFTLFLLAVLAMGVWRRG